MKTTSVADWIRSRRHHDALDIVNGCALLLSIFWRESSSLFPHYENYQAAPTHQLCTYLFASCSRVVAILSVMRCAWDALEAAMGIIEYPMDNHDELPSGTCTSGELTGLPLKSIFGPCLEGILRA
jgi:hypothetical protein